MFRVNVYVDIDVYWCVCVCVHWIKERGMKRNIKTTRQNTKRTHYVCGYDDISSNNNDIV